MPCGDARCLREETFLYSRRKKEVQRVEAVLITICAAAVPVWGDRPGNNSSASAISIVRSDRLAHQTSPLPCGAHSPFHYHTRGASSVLWVRLQGSTLTGDPHRPFTSVDHPPSLISSLLSFLFVHSPKQPTNSTVSTVSSFVAVI